MDLKKVIHKTMPLTANYEYAGELGMILRATRFDWWQEFLEASDYGRLKSPQVAGFYFIAYLEDQADDPVSKEVLVDEIIIALRKSASRLKKEFLASEHFLETTQKKLENNRPPLLNEYKTFPGDRIAYYESDAYLGSETLSRWIDRTLQPYNLDSQIIEQIGDRDLYRVHSQSYIEGLRESEEKAGVEGPVFLTPETFVAPLSEAHWRKSAAAVLTATANALREYERNGNIILSICKTSPGSHHAERNRGGGTCLINNLAVGAAHVLNNYKLFATRPAILDIDAHHGNGIQEIFYKTSDVATASVHQDQPFFPGTGDEVNTGEGAGIGANKNVVVRPDDNWLKKVGEAIRFIEISHPDIVFLELSGDAHILDPVSDLEACGQDFFEIGKRLRDLKIPVVAEIGAATNEAALQSGVQGFINGYLSQN